MPTMLLGNDLHNPPGPGGGQFAPKGGGTGGGTSAARMTRITRQAAHATATHGMTRQCAYCGKMLNGPMEGTRIALPHRTPAGSQWTHGMCPDCGGKMSRYSKERTAGHVSPSLKRWESHFEAMQRDQAARIQADAGAQADEGVVGMRLSDLWQRPIRLGETTADGHRRSWIMLMPQGNYEHPEYGKLKFTHALLNEFKANFDDCVRKIDIALDADHKATQGDSRATGWIDAVQWRPAQSDGTPAGLWGCIDWTSYGAQLLDDRVYRYFSPEFGDYTDEASGKIYHNVIIGGALTNRPFLKVMPSVALAETSNRSWGSVDKSSLPKSCFLWVAGPNKSDWHLPVYESNGQGGRGALNINAVKAAFGALHGARSGKAMSVPPSVRSRIISLHNKYFGQSAQAHEGMKGGAMARNYQFASKTPLRVKGSGSPPADHPDVTDYDPGDEDDPTQFADGETDDEQMAEDDAESYDDGGDDGEDEPDDNEPFGGKKAPPFKRGGKQMARKTASKSGGKSMSETSVNRQLAEMQRQMAERDQQLAELQYRDYTRDIDDILRTWRDGKTMTFFAAETASLPKGKVTTIGGKRVERKRTIAMTPSAERAARKILHDVGFQLSEGNTSNKRFRELADAVQTLLSENALVDLTRYGSSFDQEARKTISLASRQQDAYEGADMQELAESLASQAGKTFASLSLDEKMHYYSLAEQEA